MSNELGGRNETVSLAFLNSLEYEKAPEAVARAYEFGKKAHGTQTRYDGVTPYFDFHCVGVDNIVHKEWKIDDLVIREVCLLHDTFEDTNTTFEDLRKEFGERVAFGVESATKFSLVQSDKRTLSHEELDKKTIVKMYDRNLNDPSIVLPKMADRLFNIRDLETVPDEEKKRKKAEETLNNYAPLAESLGLWRVKYELENRCLAYTDPEAFRNYTKIISEDSRTDKLTVENMKSELRRILAAEGIDAEVDTRLISLVTLQNKNSHAPIDKINDLISYRIKINHEGAENEIRNEVYKTEGAIRSRFAEIEDFSRYDDYYAVPTYNGYSALQLTLNTPGGAVEIAITSEKKEEYNKEGIIYLIKQGEKDLRKHALKMVFLPSGQVKYLPQEAIGADVAYSIHEALGAQANAIMVDGEMNEISTVVPNGSSVNIIRGENRMVPLDKILMDMSLSKTRKIMKNQYDEQEMRNIVIRGKDKIQKIIMKQGILDLADLYKFEVPSQNLTNMLSELGCKDKLENLYYLIEENLMPLEKLETNLIIHNITKRAMGLTTLYVEGRDQSGVLAHVSSIVETLGGNIGLPELERKIENGKVMYKLRLVIENLKGRKVGELKKAISTCQKDKFDKILVV